MSGTVASAPRTGRFKWYWLALPVICGGVLWWLSYGNVCNLPLAYRVGQIDGRFELTQEELLLAISEAERWWEDSVGRDLFQSEPDAEVALVFNMVYDERQQATQEMQKIEGERQKVEGELANITEKYSELRPIYDQRAAVLEELNVAYSERLAKFETTVQGWNSRGGAPPGVYDELQQERAALDQQAAQINSMIAEQNELAGRINRLADAESETVGGFNEGVREFNDTFAAAEGTEEEQGIFGSGTINVYQFDDRRDLVMLLAHEMGHALGLDHVDDPQDVMYPKKNERQVTGDMHVSDQLLRDLEKRCNLK